MHNLRGAIEYLGGGFALLRISGHFGQPFKAMGFIMLGATLLISLPAFSSVRGMGQRFAELSLFGGVALAIRLATTSA